MAALSRCVPASLQVRLRGGGGVVARPCVANWQRASSLCATTRARGNAAQQTTNAQQQQQHGDDERLAVTSLLASLAFGGAMALGGVGFDDALPLEVRACVCVCAHFACALLVE